MDFTLHSNVLFKLLRTRHMTYPFRKRDQSCFCFGIHRSDYLVTQSYAIHAFASKTLTFLNCAFLLSGLYAAHDTRRADFDGRWPLENVMEIGELVKYIGQSVNIAKQNDFI